jgi:hypothetical protein
LQLSVSGAFIVSDHRLLNNHKEFHDEKYKHEIHEDIEMGRGESGADASPQA